MRYSRCILAFFVVVAFAAGAFGATLEDYAGRVRLAKDAAADLHKTVSSGTISKEAEERLLGIIENSLPATEKVDAPGTTVVTDYTWLHEDISEYRAEKKPERRREILSSLTVRLQAIEETVSELANAEKAAPTKDSDKEALDKILQREEYKTVEPQESPLTSLLDRILNWLFSRYPKQPITPVATPGMPNLASFLQILLFLGVAIGLGFIGYKLVPHFVPRFRKDNARKRERVVLREVLSEDTTSHDLFSEAEELARSGQLTLAIRKAYIAALCGLEDRRLLKLAKYKTNRDYLFDLRKRREIVAEMSDITREFERHWYGAKESTAEDWARVAALYQQTIDKAERA